MVLLIVSIDNRFLICINFERAELKERGTQNIDCDTHYDNCLNSLSHDLNKLGK